MIRTRFLLAPLAFAAAALAQPPAPQPQPQPPPRWQVDWGQYYCSLVPPRTRGQPFATVVMVIPGGDATKIMFIPDEGEAPSWRVSSLRLLPQGLSFDITLYAERRGQRRVAIVSGLPYDFAASLAGAREIQLRDGEEVRLRIPIPDALAAVAEHRRCISEVARQWGVDEAAMAALARQPETTNVFGLQPDDYPAEALRRAIQGRVIVRIAVSAEGRATDCAAVATSGSPVIDARTCRVILTRARFRPALDANGRAVAAQMVRAVEWRMPGG